MMVAKLKICKAKKTPVSSNISQRFGIQVLAISRLISAVKGRACTSSVESIACKSNDYI